MIVCTPSRHFRGRGTGSQTHRPLWDYELRPSGSTDRNLAPFGTRSEQVYGGARCGPTEWLQPTTGAAGKWSVGPGGLSLLLSNAGTKTDTATGLQAGQNATWPLSRLPQATHIGVGVSFSTTKAASKKMTIAAYGADGEDFSLAIDTSAGGGSTYYIYLTCSDINAQRFNFQTGSFSDISGSVINVGFLIDQNFYATVFVNGNHAGSQSIHSYLTISQPQFTAVAGKDYIGYGQDIGFEGHIYFLGLGAHPGLSADEIRRWTLDPLEYDRRRHRPRKAYAIGIDLSGQGDSTLTLPGSAVVAATLDGQLSMAAAAASASAEIECHWAAGGGGESSSTWVG